MEREATIEIPVRRGCLQEYCGLSPSTTVSAALFSLHDFHEKDKHNYYPGELSI